MNNCAVPAPGVTSFQGLLSYLSTGDVCTRLCLPSKLLFNARIVIVYRSWRVQVLIYFISCLLREVTELVKKQYVDGINLLMMVLLT